MNTATHFFLGANSGRGFQNLFQRFCTPEDHYDLVILKGGPGFGKSTLMKRLGAAMEERGEQVEYLHCSGDPDSLDGVHIPRIRAAVVDGTAPHIMEPGYPVAADRCVNLGECCYVAAAKAARDEIVRYTDACTAAYSCAYRTLGAAAQLAENSTLLVKEGLDMTKLLRRTEGIISREIRGRGSGGGEVRRFLGSVTCRGLVWRFDSVETLCPRIYQLQDSFGLAAPLLERVRAAAAARGFRYILCPDPEHMDRIEHLLIPELELAFVTSREGMLYRGPAYRRIRVDAMVDAGHYKRHKARLRFCGRMVQELRQEAQEALQKAKKAHDDLESIYHPCVDFDAVSALTEREIRRFESYL